MYVSPLLFASAVPDPPVELTVNPVAETSIQSELPYLSFSQFSFKTNAGSFPAVSPLNESPKFQVLSLVAALT